MKILEKYAHDYRGMEMSEKELHKMLSSFLEELSDENYTEHKLLKKGNNGLPITLDNKQKLGMYGETPKIKIGELSICMFTDKKDEVDIWVSNAGGEGAQFRGESKAVKEIGTLIEGWFNKYL